jgi:inorganic pyrophosphatase
MSAAMFEVEAIVEIPRGNRNKYEYDPSTGTLRLDRVLYSSVHYPGDYGLIVDTLGGDGDPLDVLILVEEPTFPGCRVRVRPIGALFMRDGGKLDTKILGVPTVDPRFSETHDLKDLPSHWLTEVKNFFEIYKVLEGKTAALGDWQGRDAAIAEIQKRMTRSATR